MNLLRFRETFPVRSGIEDLLGGGDLFNALHRWHNGPAFMLAGGKNTKLPELTKPGKRRMVLTAARLAGRKGFVMLRHH